MLQFDFCNSKITLPLLIALLVVAQVDFASAFDWPHALLSVLHLTPAPDDLCRGICAGIGASLDVIVIYQLVRIWARRRLGTRPSILNPR
jgi:hypothetical protein